MIDWIDVETEVISEEDWIADNLPNIEAVSSAVHGAWMANKLSQGITSRCAEDGEELMSDYEDLSEKAKDLDRVTVRAVYKAIYEASTAK